MTFGKLLTILKSILANNMPFEGINKKMKQMTNPVRIYRKLRIKQHGRQIKELKSGFMSLPRELKKQMLEYMRNLAQNCAAKGV